VALESAFRELARKIFEVGEALSGLRSHLIEDAHLIDKRSLTAQMGDAAQACIGWQFEALTAAGEAKLAAGYPLDLEKARRALVVCQEKFDQARASFEAHLASDERLDNLAELKEFKAKYPNEAEAKQWGKWVTSVLSGLKCCRTALQEAQVALTRCWQELAEKIGLSSVSVQTRVVGQEIHKMNVMAEEWNPEGGT
jgi:hypothetical protein